MKRLSKKFDELVWHLNMHNLFQQGDDIDKTLIDIKTEIDSLPNGTIDNQNKKDWVEVKYKEVRPSLKNCFSDIDKNIHFLFNPFTRCLSVFFIQYNVEYTYYFDDLDEWVDLNHPHFKDQRLRVHLLYEKSLELIVYFEGSGVNHYNDYVYWKDGVSAIDNFEVVTNDESWDLVKSKIKRIMEEPQ